MTGAPHAGRLRRRASGRVGRSGDARARVMRDRHRLAGKNVGRRGEDIVRGTTVLETGRVLRPQDLGVLSSIGIGAVPVVRRPRVRLVITGNELLPSGSRAAGFHIADANGPMLAALVERDGGYRRLPRPRARRAGRHSGRRCTPTRTS